MKSLLMYIINKSLTQSSRNVIVYDSEYNNRIISFWFNSQKVGEKWIKYNGHYAAFRYVSFLSKRTCVKKGVAQCPDLV